MRLNNFATAGPIGRSPHARCAMNRFVLFSILALAFAPAIPTAVAYDPCVKTTCVIVDDEMPWACVGVSHQFEAYGACADAESACAATRSGRLWQEYCLAQPSSQGSSDGVCVGVAPELDGPMACANVKERCASTWFAFERQQVCASDVAPYLP